MKSAIFGKVLVIGQMEIDGEMLTGVFVECTEKSLKAGRGLFGEDVKITSEADNCPTEEEYKRTEQKKHPLCDSCCKLTECIINGDISTGDGVFECDEYEPLF